MNQLRYTIAVALAIALSSCMQLNTAGMIDNIGREYDAALVYKGTRIYSKKPLNWDACEADGKLYIKARKAVIREQTWWLRDGAFTQLPHKVFHYDGELGELCYYHDGELSSERPEGATDTTIAANSVYPFYTVQSSREIKPPVRYYEPIWMEERPNPHRFYTAPLSWIAAVAVDIPGSLLFTTLALPGEIYSAISD